jgi:hypothetical protein
MHFIWECNWPGLPTTVLLQEAEQAGASNTGGSIQRHYLAATHWTNEAFGGMLQTAIDKICACMKCASTLKNCARIRKDILCAYNEEQEHWIGNQTMAVQYDCTTHEAMAKARLFENLVDDSNMKEIDDSYSPLPKNVKPSLLRAQVKRDFDDYRVMCFSRQCWP